MIVVIIVDHFLGLGGPDLAGAKVVLKEMLLLARLCEGSSAREQRQARNELASIDVTKTARLTGITESGPLLWYTPRTA